MGGREARILTWEQLAFELDFGVSGDTMKRALGRLASNPMDQSNLIDLIDE
jgi:hypothetical protein